MNTQHTVTHFEQIGGMPAVDASVEIFHTKVLADDTISENHQNGRQATPGLYVIRIKTALKSTAVKVIKN